MPKTSACPDVGRDKPRMMSMVDVLPAPLGPSIATISPDAMLTSTSLTACTRPKFFLTSFSSTASGTAPVMAQVWHPRVKYRDSIESRIMAYVREATVADAPEIAAVWGAGLSAAYSGIIAADIIERCPCDFGGLDASDAGLRPRSPRRAGTRQHLARTVTVRSRRRLRQQDDLAENVALRESPVGVLDPIQRERRRDGQLQLASRDQLGEFGEHARGGRGRVALGVDPVPCDGLEIDDRVDAGRLHAELEGQLHVARPERVDERIHLAGRLPDPVRHPVAVGHRDDTMPGKPRVVSLAGQTDHGGIGLPGQLDRDRADPARRPGDHHRVA